VSVLVVYAIFLQCGHLGQQGLTLYYNPTDFESESGCGKVLSLATILQQVFIEQSYSLTPEGPIRKCPSHDIRAYKPPGPTIGLILNLKTVLASYCHWL
jgi:hypothetical protein